MLTHANPEIGNDARPIYQLPERGYRLVSCTLAGERPREDNEPGHILRLGTLVLARLAEPAEALTGVRIHLTIEYDAPAMGTRELVLRAWRRIHDRVYLEAEEIKPLRRA